MKNYYEELYGRLRKLEEVEKKRKSWEYALDLNQIDEALDKQRNYEYLEKILKDVILQG
jgi:hypothetical protein